MIRSPLALRLDPARPVKDAVREAARLGAKGVVLDATGELAPDRLSETGRREVRHLLRTVQVGLVALNLPTRRPFDTDDQLDDRLRRAEKAFQLAYDLGSQLVLARVGALPPESQAEATSPTAPTSTRREILMHALRELGLRADHRGVRLAIETGTEPGPALRQVLEAIGSPGLAASLDPGTLALHGFDPAAVAVELGPWVAHAYAPAPAAARPAPAPAPAARLITPTNPGLPAGATDWEAYLGALEEINYRGYLTLWPDPTADLARQFTSLAERLARF